MPASRVPAGATEVVNGGGERNDGHVYVPPVRAFPPNARGVLDAVGNV